MIPPCLLSLADLNDAAPGVLDVVFGPDGDFEGAPLFRGPVRLTDGRYVSMDWLLCQPWDLAIMHRMASLDLRVPSVAARLAGLCAQALGHHEGTGWRAYRMADGWALTDWSEGLTQWTLSGLIEIPPRLPTSEGWSAADPTWTLRGGPWETEAHFLASLFLSLAPRIAALRKP